MNGLIFISWPIWCVALKRDENYLINYTVLQNSFLDVSLDYLGAIPFDERVHESVKKQKPVLLAHPECQASKALQQLAVQVESWPFKFPIGGNTSFFLERLVNGEH